MAQITMAKALNAALRDAMEADGKVVLLGEDVGTLGGVFRITDGLLKDFGEQRVMDTPLAESGIIGISIGLAIRGYRPVPEMQFDGFSYPALDQIFSHLAKYRNRSRGFQSMPVVVRIPFGGGIGSVEHHSESPETLYAHTAGLKVVAPSTPADAYSLLRESIEIDDPVIFLEPKRRYWAKQEIDLPIRTEPIGRANVLVQGDDCTLVAYGPMVKLALDAAQAAAEEGLGSLEVIEVRSLVPEGDSISLNQPIVEVETAKAMVEIPAPYAGTITRLHAKEGDSVEVGSPLISVDTGEPAAGGNGSGPAAEAASGEESGQAHLVGPGERPQTRRRRATAITTPPAVAPAPVAPEPAAPAARPMATPPVRKYAKDRGIELAQLEGTGKDGRITHQDVDRALTPAAAESLEGPAAAALGSTAPRVSRERVERTIPVTGTRKLIAAAMVASKFSIPHVTEFLTVDASNLMALRTRLKALPAAAEVRITPLAIIARAVCAAVRQYPLMNSSWDEQSSQIVVKEYVNL